MLNIFGKPLKSCNMDKITGYDRSGYCVLYDNDPGTHIVCAIVDDQFLNFTRSKGNNLITPFRNFPGLKKGDKWCICVLRWIEAYKAGYAPKIDPNSTHISTLSYIPKEILLKYII